MNTGNLPLIITQMDCKSVVLLVTTALKSAGYMVLKSFDLNSVIPVQGECDCDSNTCTCQLVVLLVYPILGPPATLLIDSHGSRTIINLANNSHDSIYSGWTGILAQILNSSLPSIYSLTHST
jgi:hypothetical protein